MQIKLVILTICASLVAIGFAAPSPQAGGAPSPGGQDLQAVDPNDSIADPNADPNAPPPEGPSPQLLDLTTESLSDDPSLQDFDPNAPIDAPIDAALDAVSGPNLQAADPNADSLVPPSDGSSPQFFNF
ncbi:hypothetical protein RMATCC62417_13830 [Rhizopus microsporus]|nr:hypothetical protein RMATCC62417_13828 [Rhizopus microsporus]CEG79348.1 hypothetical protein RMATCC62417_13830 [Rhizopus microsporus]